MALLGVLGICTLLVAFIVGKPYLIEYRRAQCRRRPFPAEWEAILNHYLPHLQTLPAELRRQLRGHIQVFVAEKKFVGCGGLEISDDIRITIAAQACLLILNRKTDYFPALERILVYPGAFVVDKMEQDEAGVLSAQRDILAGESWEDGQVLLSWEDTVAEAGGFSEGRNIVIHEFAHQLDQESGPANGAPFLPSGEHYRRWSEVFSREFDKLRDELQEPYFDTDPLFDDDGAEHPAEFFAAASEVFFARPREMAERCPDLYRELAGFYRVDPAAWRAPGKPEENQCVELDA